MSCYLEQGNFKGAASWMRLQATEELAHSMKYYDYLNSREARVILTQLPAPKENWASLLNVFEEAYKHECEVSQLINDLVNFAEKEQDNATVAFMQYFLTEQVEEENSLLNVVSKLKLIKEEGPALYMLDKELGKRSLK